MADARITQLPVEVLYTPNPNARLTQLPVEVLSSNLSTAVLTQLPIEVLRESDGGQTNLTQLPIEVLRDNDYVIPPPDAKVSQDAVELTIQYDSPPARTSQISAEHPLQYEDPPTRTSQISAEHILQYDSPPARTSHITAELLHQYDPDYDKARVSQISFEIVYPFTECFVVCPRVDKFHLDPFVRGQASATYEITVTNDSGDIWIGPTTVTDTLPTGLTLVSMSGEGWTCLDNVCTRTDQLPVDESFPPIIVLVNVAEDAPDTVTNIVEVSGTVCSAEDLTNIVNPRLIPARTPVKWALHRMDIKTRMEERN